jgi:hypothetical protein
MQELFYQLINTIGEKRKKYPSYDGQKYWQAIKVVTRPFDDQLQVKWKSSIVDDDDLKVIMNLVEYTINGNGEKKINESNHFLIQLVRIPQQDAGTLTKVLQVALNIGQLLGVWPPEEVTFISDRQLESIDTYLDDTQIELLNQFLAKHPSVVKEIELAINSCN